MWLSPILSGTEISPASYRTRTRPPGPGSERIHTRLIGAPWAGGIQSNLFSAAPQPDKWPFAVAETIFAAPIAGLRTESVFAAYVRELDRSFQ